MNTDKNLNELIEQLKKASPDISAQKVKALIESGKPSPFVARRSFQPRRTKLFNNPLKFVVMITPIIIITSALLIWNPVHIVQKPEVSVIRNEKVVVNLADNHKVNPGPATPLNRANTVPEIQEPVISQQKDTVFKGDILELSKEDFVRLGFMFDEEGYYYLNLLPDQTLLNLWSRKRANVETNGFGYGINADKDNKQSMTTHDFYPVFLTNTFGKDRHMMNALTEFFPDQFNLMNDTLVPILFSAGTLTGITSSDLLLWIRPSDAFFELIGTKKGTMAKKRIERVKEIQSSYSVTKDRVLYGFPGELVETEHEIIPAPALKLKPEIFTCMGFQVDSKAVGYRFVKEGKFLTIWIWEPGIGSNQRWQVDSTKYLKDKVLLYFITNNSSNKGCPTSTVLGNRDKMPQEFEFCVPVQLDDPDCSEKVRSSVFWIYPNEVFFKCLPPEIAGPLLMEFNYQIKRLDPNFVPLMGGSIGIGGQDPVNDSIRMGGSIGIGRTVSGKKSVKENMEPVPCVYFTNLCETLPGLDYVNLYPNPATDKLNVDLVLSKAKTIRFRVIDMGGRVITDYGVPENYSEGGQFKHQIDLSNIQSGLYVLVMTDEEGAKLTRRFVKY